MVIGSLPNISLTMPSGRKIPRVCSLTVYDVDSRMSQIECPGLDGTSSSSSSSSSSASSASPGMNENNVVEKPTSEHSPLDNSGGIRERIKQMQVEAEIRRDEFARLLDEHAQVVKKLKMMEAEEQLSSAQVDGTVIGSTHA